MKKLASSIAAIAVITAIFTSPTYAGSPDFLKGTKAVNVTDRDAEQVRGEYLPALYYGAYALMASSPALVRAIGMAGNQAAGITRSGHVYGAYTRDLGKKGYRALKREISRTFRRNKRAKRNFNRQLRRYLYRGDTRNATRLIRRTLGI